MFLKNITINKYKSIQKATVGFEDGLNIIIGKNGSGKSNLLEFINDNIELNAILSGTSKNVNFDYQYTISYVKNKLWRDVNFDIKSGRIYTSDGIETFYEIESKSFVNGISNGNTNRTKVIEKDKERKAYVDLYKFIKNYSLFSNICQIKYGIPKEIHWLDKQGNFEINSDLYFDSSDYGFSYFKIIEYLISSISIRGIPEEALTFDALKIEDAKKNTVKVFDDFIKYFRLNYFLSTFSPIKELRISHNINVYKTERKILVENLLIDFKINDSWVPWSYLSDGTKRLFYLITQCLCVHDDGLLLIEEPELGIHPHQLFSLMTFLKEQSRDKQIIISTHSPIVLDILEPGELDRITIAKIEKNGSQFYKLNEEQKETAQKYMSEVGDLSYYWLHSDLENE